MSYEDFCRLTPEEAEEAFRAWRETREAEQRECWERMRLHAVMTMQPHCKKRLSPAMVLPLPWDKKTRGRKECAPVDKEEQKAMFLKRLGRG